MAKAEVVITAVDRTQQAIQSATKGMRGLNDSALLLKKTLGAISVAAVGAFFTRTASQALELGDSINKAAMRAGVTVEAMGELSYAAKLADVDMGSLTKSLNLMQRALGSAASGKGEVSKALKALGLDFKDIQRLAPEEQFKMLADRIMAVDDPIQRMNVGTQIFGRSFAELIPLLSEGSRGMNAAAEEARRLGVVLSKETAESMTAAKDAIDKLSLAWQGFSTTLISKVAPALTSVLNEIAGIQPAEIQLTRAVAEVERLKSTLAGLPGTGGQFGEQLRSQIDAQIEIIRQLQQSISEKSEIEPKIIITLGDEVQEAINPFLQELSDLLSFVDLEAKTRTTLQRQVALFEQFDSEVSALLKGGAITVEDANERIGEQLDRLLTGVTVTGKRFVDTSKEDISQLTIFAEQAARNMQTAFADFLFDPFQNGLKGMLKGFVDTIRRMVAEFAASQLMKFFFTPFATGSGLLASFAKFAIGGKAMGGSVMGSKPYIVGERGPELFIPGSNGSIVPNDRMGGVTVAPVYNIDARGATADLQKALPGILQENNRRIFDELDRRYGIGR